MSGTQATSSCKVQRLRHLRVDGPRSGRCLRTGTLAAGAALLISAALSGSAQGQLYWDVNGATAGSGNLGGTWDVGVTSNWTTDSTGASATTTFTGADTNQAVFSAGADGTGPFTVTLSGSPDPNGILFEEGSGTITIIGGTSLVLSGDSVNVASGVTGRITSTISAATAYTKDGTGTLTIGAAYTGGGVTVNAGIFGIGGGLGGDAFNPTGTTGIVVNSGGTLRLDQNNAINNAEILTINSGGTLDRNGFGDAIAALSGAGTITGGGTFTLDLGSTQTFSGSDTGGNLTLRGNNGTGTQILTGTASYGTIRIERGPAAAITTLELAGAGTTTVTTINIGLAGSGSAVLNVKDTHTVNATNISNGEATSQPGTINQTGGTVNVSGLFRMGHWPTETSNYNISAGALNLTGVPTATINQAVAAEQNGVIYLGVDGTGNLTVSGTASVSAQAIVLDARGNTAGTDTFTLNGGTVTLTSTTGFGNGIRTGSSDANASYLISLGTGTLAAGTSWASPLNMTLTGDTTFDTNANTITLSGVLSGAGGLIKTDTGTLTLSGGGANTYTGTSTLSQGTIQLSKTAALGTGPVTINDANTAANNTSLLATTPITINNTITVANQGTGTATIGTTNFMAGSNTQFGGTLTLAKDVTLQAGSSDRTTFAGQITGTGNVTVTSPFAANRRIVFDRPAGAANDFVGDITLSTSADLQIGVANSLGNRTVPDSTDIFFNTGSRLRIAPTGSGDGETMGNLQSVSPGAGTVDMFTGTSFTLTIGSGGGTGDFSGVITDSSGTLALTKTGTGTQTLSGANTYAGATTINDGTLLLAGGSDRLPTTTNVTINGPGILDLDGQDQTVASLTLSGGTVNGTTGTDTLTISGPITSSGTSAINGIGDTLDVDGNSVNVTGGILTVTRNLVNGGGGDLDKLGTGTLVIGGGAMLPGGITSAAGGAISITGGTVDLGGSDVSTPSASFSLAGGILENVDTLDGDLNQSGGTLINSVDSPDTMTITGDYNQTGGTFVVDIAGNFLGDYDIYDVGGTATLNGVLKINLLDDFEPGLTGVTGIFFDVLVANMITIGPNFSLDTSMAQFTSSPYRGWAYEIVDLGDGRFALRLFVTPEPASVLVWGVAGLAALLYARRRRWLPSAGGR